MQNGPEKNVEAQLLGAKVFRRKPGDVPYPVEHSSATFAFDIWDNMFFRSHWKDLTMCQIDKPPAVVLDIGCGSGYWVLEAAKKWKTSAVIGFDVQAMQPNLSAIPQYQDIAHRVKWLHGNLLEGLPFPSSSIDFVRIVNVGLGVPEDEWQHVFEEVVRVMKPGAAIEVIEEDPIFPCPGRPSLPPQGQPQLPPISLDGQLESPPGSAFSTLSPRSVESDTSHGSSLDDAYPPGSPPNLLSVPPTPPSGSSPMLPYTIPSLFQAAHLSRVDKDYTPDPCDHSKLQAAWHAMLSSRFIPENLSNVLPFYFSSFFTDVQIHEPFQIPLPPNSGQSKTRPRELSLTESLSPFILSGDPSSTRNSVDKSCPYDSTWHNMHLAKTVNTVKGCKTAIWEEYKKLYAGEFRPTMARRTLLGGARSPSEAALREAFDDDWSGWENDMLDRIGLRGCMSSTLGWPEPPGDKPGWRTWRSHVDDFQASREAPCSNSLQATSDPDLCRLIRAYVGWKP